MTAPPLIARLATHLQRPVPQSVRTKARLHLLDWLACVAGARETSLGVELRSLWQEGLELREIAVLLGNYLEMDDVHREALLHPGPVIWPVVVYDCNLPFTYALDFAVEAYEAMIAVGATFDAHHYSHWHPTATAGAVGAAYAANAANGRSLVDGVGASAMANAASVAGGVWHMRHDDVFTKQWHVAHAVETGRRAAKLAAHGVSGPLAILEGPQGLYAAMCNDPKPMVFGPGWRIEEVSFKPWAACRHAHPVIDCALELRAAGKLTAPFRVETYADAVTFCDRPDPATEVDAKFSLQHAVAVIADGRDARPEDFTPEAIAALSELRARVTVVEAPEITARYPAHFGTRLNGFELQDCRGDPERPVGKADIIAKMHMLAEWGGLPASEADRAADLALNGNDAGAIVVMLEDWLS